MNYTLSIQKQKGQADRLTLSGHLTIKTCQALQAELLEHAKKQKGIALHVQEVEDLDVAFLQLLLALQNYNAACSQPFSLHLDVNTSLQQLLQVAGINKTLNTNPS